MHSIIIHDQELPAPEGLQVLNFKSGGQFRFINQRRIGEVNELVLHETVTSSARATLDVLQQRNLGVHFILGVDGTVHQHGDLRDDFLWHAAEHNPKSVGIEVVNPYYPELMPRGGSWSRTIEAPWAHKGTYVVPPILQAEALATLVGWLLSDAAVGISIPKKWAGISNQRMAMGPTPSGGPGVYAHHYFGHTDGSWLALYCWLRLEPGLDPETAHEAACQLATKARGSVDLSEFYAINPYLT
jgi:N-acetylmuramoyl-L-alanine amidase